MTDPIVKPVKHAVSAYRTASITALLISLGLLAASLYAYFFTTTELVVHAHSSTETIQALQNGDATSRIQIWDAPIDGQLLLDEPLDDTDISYNGELIELSITKPARTLPLAGYIQICVDGDTQGQKPCGQTNAAGTETDRVSCTRPKLDTNSRIFKKEAANFTDVTCKDVTAALYVSKPTQATSPQHQIEVAEASAINPADLTEAINEYFAKNQLPIEPVTVPADSVSATGPGHSENQKLEFDGTHLTLTNGNTVDLSSLELALPPPTTEPIPKPTPEPQKPPATKPTPTPQPTPQPTPPAKLEAQLKGTQLVLSAGAQRQVAVDLSALTKPKDEQKIEISDGKLRLYGGTGNDTTVDLAQFTRPVYSPSTPSTIYVNPFANLNCSANEYVTNTAGTWQCRNPRTAETLTTIGYNQNTQNVTYTDENQQQHNIPITVLETTTEINNTLNIGHIIGEFTNEDGQKTPIVETVSTIVDNGDNTYTYTNENGEKTVLDTKAKETLTAFTNTIAGSPIAQYQNEAGNLITLNETVTTLKRTGKELHYQNEGGTVNKIDLADLETLTTVTSLLASGNRIGTYTDENSNTYDLKETVTRLIDNGDQTITFHHEDGTAKTLDIRRLETLTRFIDLAVGNPIATYIDEHGDHQKINETITEISTPRPGEFSYRNENGTISTVTGKDLETLTKFINLAATGNQIGTYIDEDGTTHHLKETITNLQANADRSFSYTNEAGTQKTIQGSDLETLTTFSSVITGNHIATYIDEAGTTHQLNETITTLKKVAGTKAFAYTDETGTEVTITGSDIETLTSVTKLVTGHPIARYIDENAVSHRIDETITALSVNNSELTFTHEDGTTSTIAGSELETLTVLSDVLTTGKAIGVYRNEQGVETTLNETITTIANNNDGSFTFTNENGTQTTLSGRDLETITKITNLLSAGHRIASYTSEDNTSYDILESVTKLTDNNNGSFTFTHEGGTETTLSGKDLETLTSVSATITGNRIGTYTDENGQTVDLNETITTLALDTTARTLTFTNEQGTASTFDIGALEKVTTLNAVLTSGHNIGTYTNENGAVTTLKETVTSLSATGSTLTFTDETGQTFNIDAKDLTAAATYVDSLTTTKNQIGTFTNRDGTATQVNETVTTLTDNLDGTYTYSSENKTETVITDNDTLGELNCTTDQIATYNGTAWVCADPPTLQGATKTIQAELYAAGWDVFPKVAWTRGGVTLTKTGTGQWTVTFPQPHPYGKDYAVSLLAEENPTARDSPLVWINEQSKTANGFDFSIVIGDNGDAADVYRDESFSLSVSGPVDVLVPGP